LPTKGKIKMRIADKTIDSISRLISKLEKDVPNTKDHIWFRGQPKKDWKLIPSLGRGRRPVLQTEDYLIKRFRQNATLLVGNTVQSEWDWLLVMQHHGVSTRLLDWTENPIVALYFAVIEKPSTDGALWMLLPSELNMHSKIKPKYSLDIPSLDDPILENYSTRSIRSETKSRMDPIAIMAPRNTPRI
jgi:hypothetical protein